MHHMRAEQSKDSANDNHECYWSYHSHGIVHLKLLYINQLGRVHDILMNWDSDLDWDGKQLQLAYGCQDLCYLESP